jgi:CubicO group peptidase (beta-lactamase class C family)
VVAKAFGLADRAHEIANTVDTVFAIASGTKGFTALTVMSLVQDGAISLSTTARSVLGGDLPLIDDAVTVEHLLAHRSGIGDYSFRSVSDSARAIHGDRRFEHVGGRLAGHRAAGRTRSQRAAASVPVEQLSVSGDGSRSAFLGTLFADLKGVFGTEVRPCETASRDR